MKIKLFSKISNLSFILLVQISVYAQVPAIEWQQFIGGINNDYAASIKPTSDGGYIIAGYSNSIDGGILGTNHGYFDAMIAKLDSNGSVEWQKLIGGTSNDYAYSAEETSDGGYIMAGSTDSNDGDVIGNFGYNDGWIIKFDSSGIIQWQNKIGGAGYDITHNVIQTPDGGYIVAGQSDSNNNNDNHGGKDIWILKLSNTGDIEWQKMLGGTHNEYINDLGLTTDGGYIITGQTQSNDGDVSGNHGATDAWVVKLNSIGNIDWQKTLGGVNDDYTRSITQTTDGGYIMAGSTSQENLGTLKSTIYSGWVVKLNDIGDIDWQKKIGGTGSGYFESIKQTTDEGYVIAGFIYVNVNNVTDAWIVKIDTIGNVQWEKTIGAAGYDYARSIIQTLDGGYCMAGQTSSNDGEVSGNHGNIDAWIVKLGADNLPTTNFDKQDMEVYPNPATSFINLRFSNELAVDRLVITDITGKTVKVINGTSFENSDRSINIQNLSSGMYIIEVIVGEKSFRRKFIKN